MIKKLILTAAAAAACCALSATFAFSAAFDDITVGARGKGLGGAFTAGADDASAIYWNPSMLGRAKKPVLGASWQDLYGLGLVNYSFVGYVHPGVGKGSVGFGWTRLGTTGAVTFMNYAENTMTFSYGKKIASGFYAGASVKYFSVDYDVKASGMGADLAGTYSMLNDNLRVALMWYNLNNPQIRWETLAVDTIPSAVKLGTRFALGTDHALYVDAKKQAEKQAEFAAGWEGWFFKTLALRAGASRQDEKLNTAFGLSLAYNSLRFDYALEKHYALGYNTLFNLSIGF
jgi:hypothetical protein